MPSLPLSIKIRDTSVKRAHFLQTSKNSRISLQHVHGINPGPSSLLCSIRNLYCCSFSLTRLCLPCSYNFRSPAHPFPLNAHTDRSYRLPQQTIQIVCRYPSSRRVWGRALYQASAVPALSMRRTCNKFHRAGQVTLSISKTYPSVCTWIYRPKPPS